MINAIESDPGNALRDKSNSSWRLALGLKLVTISKGAPGATSATFMESLPKSGHYIALARAITAYINIRIINCTNVKMTSGERGAKLVTVKAIPKVFSITNNKSYHCTI